MPSWLEKLLAMYEDVDVPETDEEFYELLDRITQEDMENEFLRRLN